MFRFGLFERAPGTAPIPIDEHAAAAREIGAAGTVLLRNVASLLPLDPTALSRIAVLGPWATKAATGGGGSSMVNPIRTVTPLDAIARRAAPNVTVLTDDGDPASGALVAAQADVAIVVVGDVETEGGDRQTLALPDGQDAFIAAVAAANPRTVVVVHAGAPVLMPWADRVGAIIEGWYPGGEDGEITAAVLFGDVTPSGKLPITLPRADGDGPANVPERYPGVNGTVSYAEGLAVGYRWYDATGTAPRFPFGFGLSYTTFEVTDLAVRPRRPRAGRPVKVQVRVTNTGRRDGAEVVQAYVEYPAELAEPPRQLRAFRKVPLRPGQSRRLTLTLDPRTFATWDPDAHAFLVTPGTYRVHAGTSSVDLPLVAEVTLRGAAQVVDLRAAKCERR